METITSDWSRADNMGCAELNWVIHKQTDVNSQTQMRYRNKWLREGRKEDPPINVDWWKGDGEEEFTFANEWQ